MKKSFGRRITNKVLIISNSLSEFINEINEIFVVAIIMGQTNWKQNICNQIKKLVQRILYQNRCLNRFNCSKLYQADKTIQIASTWKFSQKNLLKKKLKSFDKFILLFFTTHNNPLPHSIYLSFFFFLNCQFRTYTNTQ